MQADAATAAAVKAVLDKLAEVYVTRDAAVLRALFAPDADVVMYSPGDSKSLGVAAIVAKAELDWSKTESASLAYRWLSISAAGPAAWAAADADFTVRAAGQTRTVPVRITFVLEQRGGQWLIAHAHYSIAAGAPAKG